MGDSRAGGPFSGLVSAAQQTLSLCNNSWSKPPKVGECRIHVGTAHLKWQAWGKMKRNDKKVQYEVGCRADDGSSTGQDRKKDSLKKLCKKLNAGDTLDRVSADTPADYVEKLLKVEPKHTSRPCWDTFDFAGLVAHLGAWLACCSWHPDLFLHELVDVSTLKLVPVTNLEDSAALASSAVFISQLVASRPGSGAYWVLVAAAGACGVTVATDRAILTSGDLPRFFSRSGTQLWQDLLDALRILGELYDRASAGEVFSYALMKGLHSICTVVAHSDEGGLTRDVLRECKFAHPYGGLPPYSPHHAGLPTVSHNAPYSSLVAIVDSYCIRSAAAVAHCAPMVPVTAGGVRPMCAIGCLEERSAAAPPPPPPPGATDDEKKKYKEEIDAIDLNKRSHVAALRAAIEDGYAEFAEEYCPALAVLCGMSPSADRIKFCRGWMQMAAAAVLDSYDNRHLQKTNVIAPFFWVEPTTALPSNCFGTVAEREGWASWGCGDEIRHEPFFSGLAEPDVSRHNERYYSIDFEGARKSWWLNALQGHRDAGLARLHFKRCDPDLFMNCGGEANKRGPTQAFLDRLSIGEYLWTRGQSSIPHPSEFNHFDRKLVLVVNHYDGVMGRWSSTVPCGDEVWRATVIITFSSVAGDRFGSASTESRQAKTYRTRGLEAFTMLCTELRNERGETVSDGGYTIGVVGTPDRERPRPREVMAHHARVSGDLPSRRQIKENAPLEKVLPTAPPPVAPAAKLTTKAIEPAMHAGSHVGPRLPQVVQPAAAGPPPADGAQAAAVGGGAGAAGNADGCGAAGATPGC